MEVNLPPSDKIPTNKPASSNVLLLRRPRPPKPSVLSLSSKDTRDSSTTGIAAVTFSEPPRDLSTKSRHQSLPVSQQDLYRNNIDQLIQQHANFVVNPIFPRGPEFFPPGKVIHADPLTTTNALDFLPDEIHLIKPDPSFTFNDFQLLPLPRPPPVQISHGTISRQNYLKLTSWFATNMPSQESLKRLDLEVDHQAPPARVPKRQILTELQAMINKVIKESESGSSQTSTSSLEPRWPSPRPDDTLFKGARSRFFCGQARSDSPFSNDPLISPAEVAILESMMTGGAHLSLKAHFIDRLPVLMPLLHTLTSLNLSYNSFRQFPPAVLQLELLVVLVMRNNPLKEIPDEIGCLGNLQFLCLSFCNLSKLPLGIFELSNLVNLDVSYNNFCSIPREFSKLKNLRKLNIEGNRLPGLPATALSVPLHHLVLGNNLMHPLLWRDNTKNQPQTLVDICCAVLRCVPDIENSQLSTEVLDLIHHRQSRQNCDECNNTVFGSGLTVIRSVEHSHFKVKHLPFIFTVCTPACSSLLRQKPAKFWLKQSRS